MWLEQKTTSKTMWRFGEDNDGHGNGNGDGDDDDVDGDDASGAGALPHGKDSGDNTF